MNNLLSSSAARLRDAALVAALVASGVLAGAGQAKADELDDILSSGTLRCGVMLDYPPLGYRDSNGDPQGFDVETCKDIATAMGVELEIIETPAPQRIPSLIAGTTDIAVAGTTATLERAKTVTFTRPYNMGRMFVAYKQDSGEMTQFEDLKGKTVAVVRGTINETAYLAECAKWDEGCDNLSLATNADAVTALRQGRADAYIETDAYMSAFIGSPVAEGIALCCAVPGNTDWNAMAVVRGEYGLRDWLNYFIFWQIDSGRYAELYTKFFNAPAPTLAQ